MASSPPPSPTTRQDYINPILSSPSNSPVPSPASSPAASPRSPPAPPPNSASTSTVAEAYGPPASKKRKRSWRDWSDWIPKFNFSSESNVSQKKDEEDLDLTNLVLMNDLEGLKKAMAKPTMMPALEDRKEGVSSVADREQAAQNNPLYMAARVNRTEAAELLLANGWMMAEDRSMLLKGDPYMSSNTPIGVAYKKRNDVMKVFRKHLIDLEEKYFEDLRKPKSSKRRRLIRENSGNFNKSSTARVADKDVAAQSFAGSDAVDLVLANKHEELKNTAGAPPALAFDNDAPQLNIKVRNERVNQSPLFVAARLGREKCAETLLEKGWKMTEDRTRDGPEDSYMDSLTPIGVAYESGLGVVDVFANRIISLEMYFQQEQA